MHQLLLLYLDAQLSFCNNGRRSVKKDHAFLINSMPGGVSERLDELKVDENTTFRRLRRMIEVTHIITQQYTRQHNANTMYIRSILVYKMVWVGEKMNC